MIRKPRPPKADRSAEFASHQMPTSNALWRHDGKARATVAVPQPKDAPVRCEAYRREVAKLACIACGIKGHSQAAHGPSLGRGLKADDRTCVPLCSHSGSGCHFAFDMYLMFGKTDRRKAAEVWGRQTRKAIRDSGRWPASLPPFEED